MNHNTVIDRQFMQPKDLIRMSPSATAQFFRQFAHYMSEGDMQRKLEGIGADVYQNRMETRKYDARWVVTTTASGRKYLHRFMRKVWGDTSKYMPHQGDEECARRVWNERRFG